MDNLQPVQAGLANLGMQTQEYPQFPHDATQGVPPRPRTASEYQSAKRLFENEWDGNFSVQLRQVQTFEDLLYLIHGRGRTATPLAKSLFPQDVCCVILTHHRQNIARYPYNCNIPRELAQFLQNAVKYMGPLEEKFIKECAESYDAYLNGLVEKGTIRDLMARADDREGFVNKVLSNQNTLELFVHLQNTSYITHDNGDNIWYSATGAMNGDAPPGRTIHHKTKLFADTFQAEDVMDPNNNQIPKANPRDQVGSTAEHFGWLYNEDVLKTRLYEKIISKRRINPYSFSHMLYAMDNKIKNAENDDENMLEFWVRNYPPLFMHLFKALKPFKENERFKRSLADYYRGCSMEGENLLDPTEIPVHGDLNQMVDESMRAYNISRNLLSYKFTIDRKRLTAGGIPAGANGVTRATKNTEDGRFTKFEIYTSTQSINLSYEFPYAHGPDVLLEDFVDDDSFGSGKSRAGQTWPVVRVPFDAKEIHNGRKRQLGKSTFGVCQVQKIPFGDGDEVQIVVKRIQVRSSIQIDNPENELSIAIRWRMEFERGLLNHKDCENAERWARSHLLRTYAVLQSKGELMICQEKADTSLYEISHILYGHTRFNSEPLLGKHSPVYYRCDGEVGDKFFNKLHEAFIGRVFAGVLHALSYLAKDAELYHGDIKPGNILLRKRIVANQPLRHDYIVKVGDYGIGGILQSHLAEPRTGKLDAQMQDIQNTAYGSNSTAHYLSFISRNEKKKILADTANPDLFELAKICGKVDMPYTFKRSGQITQLPLHDNTRLTQMFENYSTKYRQSLGGMLNEDGAMRYCLNELTTVPIDPAQAPTRYAAFFAEYCNDALAQRLRSKTANFDSDTYPNFSFYQYVEKILMSHRENYKSGNKGATANTNRPAQKRHNMSNSGPYRGGPRTHAPNSNRQWHSQTERFGQQTNWRSNNHGMRQNHTSQHTRNTNRESGYHSEQRAPRGPDHDSRGFNRFNNGY